MPSLYETTLDGDKIPFDLLTMVDKLDQFYSDGEEEEFNMVDNDFDDLVSPY